MKIQAQFLGIKFFLTTKQIKTLDDLSFSVSADTEDGDTINGKKTVKIKGISAQTVNLNYTTSPAVGGDPRAEFDVAKKTIDKVGYLFIGGKVYGKNRYKLTAVSLSVDEIDGHGNIIIAKIGLTLSEQQDTSDAPNEDAKTVKGTNQKSGLNVWPNKKEKKNIVEQQ